MPISAVCDRADQRKSVPPAFRGHADMEEAAGRVIAGDGRRHDEEQRDCGADQRGVYDGNGNLPADQGDHAHDHADEDCTDWARAGMVREQGYGCASQDRHSMDSKQEQQAAKKSESDEARNDADNNHGGGLVRQSRTAALPPPPRREDQDSRSLSILESCIGTRLEDGAPVGRWRTYPSRMEELACPVKGTLSCR